MCNTAIAAWLYSSVRVRGGSFRRLRPSAIEPDETISTSRPSPCSFATSAARAVSHDDRTSPAPESISSDEPTLTTMRRNLFKLGRAMEMRLCSSVSRKERHGTLQQASAKLRRLVALHAHRLGALRRPGFGLRRALAFARHRRLADHFDQRPQRVFHP